MAQLITLVVHQKQAADLPIPRIAVRRVLAASENPTFGMKFAVDIFYANPHTEPPSAYPEVTATGEITDSSLDGKLVTHKLTRIEMNPLDRQRVKEIAVNMSEWGRQDAWWVGRAAIEALDLAERAGAPVVGDRI